MNLKEAIKTNQNEFIALCKGHEVKTLHAFGSATNASFDEDTSDIDLLVELETQDPITRGENLMRLWEKFEVFFKRRVDLLTNASIKNPILRKSINDTKVLIYDGKEQEVSL
jgi:predicted nucleotidyltransferase